MLKHELRPLRSRTQLHRRCSQDGGRGPARTGIACRGKGGPVAAGGTGFGYRCSPFSLGQRYVLALFETCRDCLHFKTIAHSNVTTLLGNHSSHSHSWSGFALSGSVPQGVSTWPCVGRARGRRARVCRARGRRAHGRRAVGAEHMYAEHVGAGDVGAGHVHVGHVGAEAVDAWHVDTRHVDARSTLC